jgi:hypothetical protein
VHLDKKDIRAAHDAEIMYNPSANLLLASSPTLSKLLSTTCRIRKSFRSRNVAFFPRSCVAKRSTAAHEDNIRMLVDAVLDEI